MIGREKEKNVLEDCLNSNRPEFLALYGRRRVGKTYLIKEFFDNTFSFYSTGVYKCNTKQQLRVFKEALTKYGDATETIPKDWFEAFSRLERLLEQDTVKREYRSGKRIVFLDELPWMDTARSNFKSALDYFWNSWGSSQKDLVLIVCGSATSWIIKNIVEDNGGFYNRLTQKMHLMPFSLNECEQLLISNGLKLSRKQIVESYMILGGIPYYLNYLKPGLSLSQNIDKLFFGEDGPLRYEFNQLFSSLFKNSDQYVAIIKELSKNKSGLTRSELIDSKHVVEGKELTRCLDDLCQCGFIRAYTDFTRKTNGKYYQLIDPLTLFHLSFLEQKRIDSWMEFVGTPAYYTWCGLAFERVCLLHINQIKKALEIAGVSSNTFAWRSKKSKPGAQIDLLIDRKDDVINLCEIKYSVEEFEIDSNYEKELIHKAECFRHETATKKALWTTMITYAGLKKTTIKDIVACELTGNDLFRD
ncbi:hypothetical protein SAMN04487884_1537 [Butyrivibrio fibrisolvens]|uniref:ATPase domain-containing protein n=1 Tax=Butyrivibrio fibrisolvens TaxID=831 RepID=A0A1H9XAQ1_BUTFI|nr:ATP-binding protein [Butyrivibrio fibrisolvens]SES43288.1 hypothetical protein SAMN04487884_1537 [Butyrivibrio fibrisolvens]